MLNPWQAILIIAVVAVCTFLTRYFPFALFGGSKEVPHSVKYLGSILPPSVIAILVVYCIKTINLTIYPCGLPELISVLFVAGIHIWKRNNLMSIGLGTVLYMILVQFVFV